MKIKNLSAMLVGMVMSLTFSMNALAFNTTTVTTLVGTGNYSNLEQISTYGNTVAWRATDFANSVSRIYYWNGTTIQAVGIGVDPSLSNGAIAWSDGTNIFYWDGTYVGCERNIIQLTDNGLLNRVPSLDNGKIAWAAWDSADGNSVEIYYWDGTYVNGSPNITQITNNAVIDTYPKLHNGLIAWKHVVDATTGSVVLQYWDGTGIKTLADNMTSPQLSVHNDGIAWTGNVELACGTSAELLYWDGTYTDTTPNITQVTSNNCAITATRNPALYNGTIAWVGSAGPDEAIFYWNGTTITQVSDFYNIYSDFQPAIHSGGIAYVGRQDNLFNGDHQIRFVTGLQ